MSKRYLLFSLLFIALSFLLMGNAHADWFTPTAGDKSVEFLKSLFPGATGGGGSDPFSALFNVINGAALTVGGVLAAYTIFAGTIGTAHEGEMLGKKFSSIWVPIRTVVGVAGVVPASSGYSGIQIAVMWLVMQGIGLADSAWSNITTAGNLATLTNIKLSAGVVSPGTKEFVQSLVTSATCMQGLKEEVKKLTDGNTAVVTYKDVTLALGNVRYNFGVQNGFNNFDSDECGYVTSVRFSPYMDGSAIGGTDADSKAFADSFNTASNNAIKAAINEAIAVADKIVSGSNVDPSEIDNIGLNYQKAIRQAVASALASSDPMKNLSSNMQADGWISAGSFYSRLAKIQSNVNNLASESPKYASKTSRGMFDGIRASYKTTMDEVYSRYVSKLADIFKQTSSYSTYGIEKQEKQDRSESLFFTLIDKLTGDFHFRPDPDDHPIVTLLHWGSGLLIAASAFLAGAVVAATTPSMVIAGMTSSVISTLLLLPFSMLLGTAFSMIYIVPMIPFFIWIGAVLGWFTMVMEAMVAAPLWFVNHLNPYGSDLTGSASNGYRLVLALILRPVLMVSGIWISMVFLAIFSPYLNRMFFATFNVTNGTGLAGFFGLLAAPFIYLVIMTTTMKKLFDLIYIIPDQILNWIGGGGAQLGGFAGSIGKGGEEAAHKAGQVLGMAGQAAGNISQARNQTAIADNNFGNDVANKHSFLDDEQTKNMNDGNGGKGFFKNDSESAKSLGMEQTHQSKLNETGAAEYQRGIAEFFSDPANTNKSQSEYRDFLKNNFKNALATQASGNSGSSGAAPIIRGQMGNSDAFAQSMAADYAKFAASAEKLGAANVPGEIDSVAAKANLEVGSQLAQIPGVSSAAISNIENGNFTDSNGSYKDPLSQSDYAAIGAGDAEKGQKMFNGMMQSAVQASIADKLSSLKGTS